MGRRKRIWEAVFLCVALWWAFPASGGASSRPASENPYKGVSTLLRFDTLGLLVWPDDKNNRTLDFISPDTNEVLSGTKEIVRQGNTLVGAGYTVGVRDAVLLHDGSNRPTVFEAIHNPDKWQDPTLVLMATPVAVGSPGGSGQIPVTAGPAWSQSVNCAPATMFQGLTVNRGDWDQDGADDVVVFFFDSDDFLNVLGVGNAAGGHPLVGKPQRLPLDVAHLMLGDHTNSSPLRSTVADLDGDGIPEIAVVYENIVLNPNSIKYRLLIFRVVPDAKMAGDWKYAVQCIADQKLDSSGSSGTHSPVHALDIAAGDFDTDGKDEIFFIGRTSPGLRWYTFEMTGGTLVQIRGDGFVPGAEGYMARAAVGDLDGDGTPEAAVFFVRNDNSLMLTWGKVAPGNNFTQALQIQPPSGTVCAAMDLTAANFTGSVVPKAYRSNAVHLASTWVRRDGQVTVALHRYDDGTRGLRTTSRHTSPVALIFYSGQSILKLLPGDYTNAGIRLGAPVHIVIEDQITPLVVMQEPPKHMDYTLVDPGKYGVLNLTRYFDFYTNFFNSQTTGTGVSSSQKAESTSALSTKSDFSFGYKCKTPVSKSDTTVQFELAAQEATAKTDETLNESYSSSSSSIKAATNGDDYVAYRCRTVDIWRYPVLGQKGLQGGEQIWLSVSVPAPQTVMNFTGMQVPWFQPPWSNGNLLSYPSDRTQLDDYAEIAKLGEGQDFLISRNKTSWEVGWTQETKKEKTHTEKVTHQSDTGFSLSEKFKVFGFHGDTSVSFSSSTDDSSEKSSTETNTFSTETSFSMESPGTFTAINNSNAYVVAPFAYKSPAGVLKVAYTARIPQGNLAWWYARYAQAPDVALNLPCVWTMKEENVWEWDESPLNNPNARRIRGFFIYDASGDMEGDAISTTQPVLLRCRVHNFSMAAPNNADPTARNVVVRFLVAPYTPSTQTEGPRKLIGNVTVPAIAPWGGLGKNWTFADMKWDVTQVSDGHYRIYVILNPDKTLPELPYHGLGETNDNNQGWYEVFVAKPQNTAQAVYNGPISAPASLSGTVQVERSGDRDLRIRGVGRNSGSRAMTDVVVTLYEGSTTSGDAFAQAYIPGILPGGEYPFTLKHRLSRADVGSLTAFLHYKLEETNWTDNIVTVTLPPAPSSPRSSGGGCVAGGLSESWALLLLVPLGALRRRR